LQISWVILFGYSKRLQEEDVYDTPMFWAVWVPHVAMGD
jgi:hypothetical protein